MTFITLVIPTQWRYNVSLSPHQLISIMNHTFSDFIYVADNTLTENFCQHVIKKFESDGAKEPGMVGRNELKRVDKTIKDSIDLNISHFDEWKYEDQVFCDVLNKHIDLYLTHTDILSDGYQHSLEDITDSGYQIQKTQPGGGYVWHHDSIQGEYIRENGARWGTFIWYLNDIEKDGYTEFLDGTKVQPKTGRLCIFPALWTYYHRGYPPVDEIKYIVTGWLHA